MGECLISKSQMRDKNNIWVKRQIWNKVFMPIKFDYVRVVEGHFDTRKW